MTLTFSPGRSTTFTENPDWLKALTLPERVNGLSVPSSGKVVPKATRRLQKWKDQGPFNKADFFTRRLETGGLDEPTLLYLLGEPLETLKNRHPAIPAWLATLARAFENATAEALSAGYKPDTSEFPLSLLPMKPLVQAGINELRRGFDRLGQIHPDLPFDPENVTGLFLDGLQHSMVSRLNKVMALEVNVARLQGQLQGDTPQARFAGFIDGLVRDGKIISLLREYPVLARQLVITVDNWVNFTLEFLSNLTQDWPLLQEKFSPDKPTGKLLAIQTSYGDNHRGGRSVLKVKFESGLKLIYKPKSLAVELHFQELLAWLNQYSPVPAFRTLKILERGSHGWEEFVEATGCTTGAEIHRFYQRQGAYLAVLYALDATDIHQENLIAAGEHPVLVDLEALFHPRLPRSGPEQAWHAADHRMQYSVMRVGLLPDRVFLAGNSQGFDISGLGSKPGQLTPKPVSGWEGKGTDHVRLVRQTMEIPPTENLPRLDGNPVNVLDYSSDIMQGFEAMYRLLLQRRAELLAGPLQSFRQDEVRVIFRNTSTYGKLLQESFHPDFLGDALDRDRFFDHLWAPIELEPHLEKIIPSEREDLHVGDVPVFNTRPDSRNVYDSRGLVIPGFLNESSFRAVEQRFAQLGEDDLTWQSWFIKASLASVDRPGKIQNGPKPLLQNPSVTSPTSPDAVIAAALKIGDRLANQALVSGENVNWVGLTLVNESAWSILPSGLDLYSGTPGIALFLAYLGQVTGRSRYTGLARQALHTIRQEVNQLKRTDLPAGAYEGWSGLIYFYSQLASLWNEPALYLEALEFVKLLPALIEKDENLDIIGGSAGVILGLLSLYKVYPDPLILNTAVQAGNHLLGKARQMPGGLGWPFRENNNLVLTGFSHGTAGIALSLLSLAHLTGESGFRTAALGAMDYERSLFSSEHHNWPDLRERESGQPDYISTWCHGAAGIALGRLASLQYIDDPALHSEIKAGLSTTLRDSFGYNHSLCHGDLGNLEPFLLAGRLFGDTGYTVAVQSITSLVLDSLEKEGPKSGIPMQVESPGLMSGLAGIGYGLLRLAAPDRVPSVLLLDPPLA
ncbi:MAG: Lantibiotic modifying enzyme [Chloroflexi bacterium]|nr:Lantibiotic modifying enzyme [Chloroflexota bacterium]